MKIHDMNENTGHIPLSSAAQLLKVPRSGYYAWLERSNTFQDKAREDEIILEEIRKICKEITGYGYRRMTVELHNRGFLVNHKRVLRLMRENDLLIKKKTAFKPTTTDSDHDNPVYPNLIKNMPITHPDQVWVSDITYIQLDRGFCYLTSILDVYLRKCIGWNISSRLDTDLALDALKMAIKSRWNPNMADLIHHSDRGVQYTSEKYTEYLQDHGIQISMSRKGNPYDNAYAESFFKTLKCEEVYLNEYRDIEDAWKYIHRFIEDVYNLKRLHSSLGYMSPIEFEMEVALNKIA